MKRLLMNLLWLLVLIACALPVMPVAIAHLRLARPSTQGTLCSPNLQIESVRYLGQNLSKDSVEVIFNGLPPTASGFNNNVPSSFSSPTVTACARYGVPPINNFVQGGLGGGVSNNISVQQGFAGGIATSQGFGYELTVTITRRFGHQDTGTAKSSNIFSGTIKTVVQIPRGAAETDPVKYDVTINTTFGGLSRRTLTAQGNGAPALAGATQTFANSGLGSSFQQNFGGNTPTENCFPSVSITGLSFTPGSGATPDAVTIDWTASRSPSDCLIGPRVFISVEVKRADNSTGHVATQPNANSFTVNLSGAPATPVSFIVRVSAETSLGQQFQVNKKGDF